MYCNVATLEIALNSLSPGLLLVLVPVVGWLLSDLSELGLQILYSLSRVVMKFFLFAECSASDSELSLDNAREK